MMFKLLEGKEKRRGYGADARLRVIRHPNHPDNGLRLDSKSHEKGKGLSKMELHSLSVHVHSLYLKLPASIS